MLVATGLFSLMHAATKTLTSQYPAFQLAALRGLAALPFVLIWLCATSTLRKVFHIRWSLQLLRGLCTLMTVVGVSYALRALPLADAYALSFAAPLLVTALSVVFLCERVDGGRWLAVVTGFVGVLIVLRPTGTPMLTFAGLAMLASATGYAGSVLLVRVLVRTDSTVNLVFWMTALLCLGAGLLALPEWRPLRLGDLPLLAGIGLAGALGQFAVTVALRLAPASVIAPFEYTALAWALMLDWVFWALRPDLPMLIGAAIVVVSGLYLIMRESQRQSNPIA
jgi:drug/metabolite transporter (DMT)-like permease